MNNPWYTPVILNSFLTETDNTIDLNLYAEVNKKLAPKIHGIRDEDSVFIDSFVEISIKNKMKEYKFYES
jgi:hypothetical protein